MAGHLPGAHHIELGELSARLGEVPVEPVTVMCAAGERATTAASILERGGRRDVTVLVGSAEDWAGAHATALETGG